MAETKTKVPAKRAPAKRTPAKKPQVELNETGQLIKLALQKGSDITTIEKLIDLQNKQEDRQARRDFDAHFALVQQELTPVKRDGVIKMKNGTVRNRYATLDAVVAHVGPILADHGFSYRWEEETILDGKEKRVTCIIAGWGWEKKTSVDIPIQAATDNANVVQQRGSSSTYGRRYSFKASVGIVDEYQDDDGEGAGFSDEVYRDHIHTLQSCMTYDELKAAYGQVYAALEGDDRGRSIMREVKNVQKQKIADADAQPSGDPDPETGAPKANGKEQMTERIEKMKEQATDAEVVPEVEEDGQNPLDIF